MMTALQQERSVSSTINAAHPERSAPPAQEWVDPAAFPEWSFVEFEIGHELRVAGVYHLRTSEGPVPYWYEDPARKHYGLVLLRSYRPVNLGDYASIMQRGRNLEAFVIICKTINDLPDPLYAIQVVRQLAAMGAVEDFAAAVHACMQHVDQRIANGRKAFERALRIIMRGPL